MIKKSQGYTMSARFIGICIGLAGLASMFYNINNRGPLFYIGAGAVVLAVFIACRWPGFTRNR